MDLKETVCEGLDSDGVRGGLAAMVLHLRVMSRDAEVHDQGCTSILQI